MASLPPLTPLPTPRLTTPIPGLSLLLPLSRLGTGPGIILLVPDASSSQIKLKIADGVPSPLLKWAEEGYTVVEIEQSALETNPQEVLKQAIECIVHCDRCEPKNSIGLVAYEMSLWSQAATAVNSIEAIKAIVVYSNASDVTTLAPSCWPVVHHIAGKAGCELQRTKELMQYEYATVQSTSFALPFQPEFHYLTDAIAHTRNLTHLKRHMGGPYFDLEQIWDEHTSYEFENRSVEHTMATMVQEPYVNHIPTLTGGIGREALTTFYRDHFIWSNPEDTEMELISRTIGIDRVVDEFIYKFTHTKEVDWILPGMPPTGRALRIPFTAIVNIRGDRLYHEHIAWDQGTVLRQLGILPDYLPSPFSIPGSLNRQEWQVPVSGLEAAQKMIDRNSVPSNGMFAYHLRDIEKNS
ncbi:NTF2-like protein [Penicillium longicatenatum]|uniref:NTF2-like protein n=1 Tax=Penicillium longicatenatum TaxID=1561947 RepID=UPI00254846DA|nr:NTF2-like protein [Penicillium longicatenatum]KAJ5642854.1 NTF2-like protein [Penicillium longicatenatum]